jgi:hypothetical protein
LGILGFSKILGFFQRFYGIFDEVYEDFQSNLSLGPLNNWPQACSCQIIPFMCLCDKNGRIQSDLKWPIEILKLFSNEISLSCVTFTKVEVCRELQMEKCSKIRGIFWIWSKTLHESEHEWTRMEREWARMEHEWARMEHEWNMIKSYPQYILARWRTKLPKALVVEHTVLRTRAVSSVLRGWGGVSLFCLLPDQKGVAEVVPDGYFNR